MMLGVLAAATLAAATVPRGGPSPEDTRRAEAALSARAEACINRNAPAVASNSESLSEAVEFLVTDLCANEVGRFATYRRSEQTLVEQAAMIAMQGKFAQMSAAAAKTGKPGAITTGSHEVVTAEIISPPRTVNDLEAAALSGATIDPDSGDLVLSPGAETETDSAWLSPSALRTFSDTDPHFRAVAAEAVLAAKASNGSRP